MTAQVSTIEIACPPEEVFDYATDPVRFPAWQPDVVSVRMLDDSRFATTRRIGGSERTMIQRITHSDPPSGWGAIGVDGPIRPHATVTIEPLDGGTRSRVTFRLDFEGHGIGIPLVPMVRRLAAKGAPISYQNLKKLLESGVGR
jgi:uncharacterized protein YndB with AHSA1/START domain